MVARELRCGRIREREPPLSVGPMGGLQVVVDGNCIATAAHIPGGSMPRDL